MPKLKTKKSLLKRIKITAKGRLKRRRASRSHLLSKKSPKRKRSLKKSSFLVSEDKKRLKKLLPYL